MKKNFFRYGVFIFLVFGLLTGCKENIDSVKNQSTSITKISAKKSTNQTTANHAKELVIKRDDVTGVRGVNTDKELLIAITVPQIDRFQLKTIEKNVKEELKKKYPDYKIEVSTDQKIFLELDILERKIEEGKTGKKELKKEFGNIKRLMKEEA
ncbi:YhcN/YlaJ family sporulation lipoprotein [Fredinandcohnia sp. QZ13]|uniref:YhcN/YlaJ family sporulation lipoprotein n=1 Tax=Fredinandcohnia sp. QZ13 TaxID=3073144 RepID=UPI0028536F19|nr:YhcN/YlaJ family sporulation lipoprotein [Fredinandcohnia sp. QZ13]MDR4889558.1 YhcN/YlaJ family sporulation lipoprotein [Fredinandcohnia sp. QZ13]